MFLPATFLSIQGDLVLQGIEVTQAVQNTQNSVPLVAGRRTTLRIYANTLALKNAMPNVKISVQASNSSNMLFSDSPRTYFATVPLSSSRSDYNSSINIPLPTNWLSGTVNLTVNLDPDNAILEEKDNNNSITQRLVFNAVPTLQVMVVPIQYHNTHNGRTYPAPSKDTVSDWIWRTYPISGLELTWHAPYAFTGDLTTSKDFSRLLSEVTTIKSSEGAPAARVYYGLIPTTDGSSTWFSGGYAGLGWVGSRASVGLDFENQTSQIAAHEIGHNLGMWHTPCGGPASPEPGFPYPDGTIGQYGLDVAAGVVYAPSTKDVMSYCNPKWVSDYTYAKLYAGQVQSGAGMGISLATPGDGLRSLLVRANIAENGVELLPAYILPGQTSELPEPGEYEVVVLDEQGQVIAQAPVRAYQAMEDGEIQATGIHAVLALPDRPAARLLLTRDGQVLAEQALDAAAHSLSRGATVEPSGSGYRLKWDGQPGAAKQTAAQQPSALVRASTDGGKTWATLGVDVTGSEFSLPAGAPKDAIFEVIAAGIWK